MAKEIIKCWCGKECHGRVGLATHQRHRHGFRDDPRPLDSQTPPTRATTDPPPTLNYCPCCGVNLQKIANALGQ